MKRPIALSGCLLFVMAIMAAAREKQEHLMTDAEPKQKPEQAISAEKVLEKAPVKK